MASKHLSPTPTRRRRSKTRSTRLAWKLRPWHVGVGVVGLLIVGGALARPKISLIPSRTALAIAKTGGLGAHLKSADVVLANGTVDPLRIAGGRLWPTTVLPAGQPVDVRLTAQTLLGWDHTRTFRVTTPKAPTLTNHHVQVNLGQAPSASFTEPVAQVRVGGRIMNAGGHLTVALGPHITVPNQSGVIQVAVRARSWEPFGPSYPVQWVSVPWLTAQASLVSQGHTNLSTAPIDITFSAPLRQAQVAQWTLSPHVSGHWHAVNGRVWQFQPSGQGFAPGTTVSIHIPSGTGGPQAQDGAGLAQATSLTVQMPQGTTLRLQQWLAELGYLPLAWSSSSSTTHLTGWNSAYQPPDGHFTWRYPNVPVALQNQWNPTYWTAMTQAAVIAFEHQEHLPVNGIPGPEVWTALRQAVGQHQMFTKPYAYVYVSETLPERLWLWVGGQVVLTTLANTGIPQDPTTLGSYGVDLRMPFQIMRGKNPNGTPYADPVHWINYFDKSQAVHGFLRAHYGFPQSLGCVEVPIPIAQQIYPHLYIGALVTVQGPGSAPLVPTSSTNPPPSAGSPSQG